MLSSGGKKDFRGISPQKYLGVTIFAIFVAELIIMLVFTRIDFPNPWIEALLDSTLLSIALFFINYRLMARPLIFHKEALEDHVQELLSAREEMEAKNEHLSQLAKDLEDQRQRVEAASVAKSQFLSIMSHELRTPLNAVIGFSEIIKEELFGKLNIEAYKEYATDIHNSGIHLLLLVDDVLDMSRIESGNYLPVKEDFCLKDVVNESVRLVEGRAGSAEVRLSCDVPGDLPVFYADKRALKQILINLLTNGVKFNKPKGEVNVTCEADETNFIITVTDTGIGIAPDDLERVLEPFAQIEREKGRIHEGAGLGLPLTNSLVEAHAGNMVIQSTLNEGTSFILTFPRLTKETDIQNDTPPKPLI